MRQKYILTQDGPGGDLHIQEFAVVDKDLKNLDRELLHHEHFDFIAEVHYPGAEIQRSISQGTASLVNTLRTPNFFPIGPYANKLAETVIALYETPQEAPLVLFFDDVDLMLFTEEETPEEAEAAEA
ncbi:MAG: hypothetical protein QNJ22_03075 [Desulfosarcinaceae bacterium]|nr:hypothetical protein [Desulfosarcinaceae bacterium]